MIFLAILCFQIIKYYYYFAGRGLTANKLIIYNRNFPGNLWFEKKMENIYGLNNKGILVQADIAIWQSHYTYSSFGLSSLS